MSCRVETCVYVRNGLRLTGLLRESEGIEWIVWVDEDMI